MIGYQEYLTCSSVSIDTRSMKRGCFFIAIKGENFDGNIFAVEALARGAEYAVVSDESLKDKEKCIYVEDTLQYMQDLAAHHRAQLKFPILAITGSNGKTTTKELLSRVLAMQYDIGVTEGNLNNHIGVPLTILGFDEDLDYGIIEMGANHIGEIAELCEIAKPDYGYITNFGKAHLEGFGSVEGVVQGKSELYKFLEKHDHIAFVNIDDKEQVKGTEELEILSFGFNQDAVFPFYAVRNTDFAGVRYKKTRIQSKLTGQYNVVNIMAATSIALHFGIAIENIKSAIESFEPNNNRSQVVTIGQKMYILDAYNANPSSVTEAIKNIRNRVGNKVAILGDMYELGTYSEEEHRRVVQQVVSCKIEHGFFIGENYKALEHAFEDKENIKFFTNKDDFRDEVSLDKIDANWILIKGSRAMKLETLMRLNKAE